MQYKSPEDTLNNDKVFLITKKIIEIFEEEFSIIIENSNL